MIKTMRLKEAIIPEGIKESEEKNRYVKNASRINVAARAISMAECFLKMIPIPPANKTKLEMIPAIAETMLPAVA